MSSEVIRSCTARRLDGDRRTRPSRARRSAVAYRFDLAPFAEFPKHPGGIRRANSKSGAQPALAQTPNSRLVHERCRGAGVGRAIEGENPLASQRASRRAFGGQRIQDGPAANGDDRRIPPDDESIAAHRRQRGLQPQLDEAGISGSELRQPAEKPDPGERGGGPDMQMHPVLVFDRSGRPGEQLQPGVHHPGGSQFAGRRDHRPPLNPEAAGSGEVERDPLAGLRRLDGGSVYLQAPDPGALPSGEDLDVATDPDLAGGERAGDDRAEAAHGEGAVDGQPEETRDVPGPGGGGRGRKCLPEFTESLAGLRRDGHQRRPCHRRPLKQLAHFEGRNLDELPVLHEINPGERHDSGPNPQQPADLDVLTGLGHDRFVGSHHQQHHVETGRAREHVAHEALVPRHIHEAVGHSLVLEMGEPEVHGDSASLLFLQPVGIGPGEREDQRTLPVVDVAGGADHHVAHGARV